jgi:UDP-2-acetamido-2-deoxy-ribo-hexuluronate aminotransferase
VNELDFRNLGAQYQAIKADIDQGIQKVIHSHGFILGKEVTQLEQELAAYVGVKHCVTCASGTDALIIPLMAWGIGKGDAVFVPDFTYFATANCALLQGAKVVLVDIDAKTFNMSPEALEAAIKKTLAEGKVKPKVIIPVDLFGQSADYPAIKKIAVKYGLKILEDGAQGFGGEINGQKACSFGDIGATSFFPAKPLGCYGDGGAIFTNDAEMAAKLRSLRASGHSPADKYNNISLGLNSRLDTLQAGILLPKLHAFEKYELKDVNTVATKYTAFLKDVVVTPYVPQGFLSSWAQYTILLANKEQRDGLQAYLKTKDIPSMIYYPRGMHQQTAVQNLDCAAGEFPNTEKIVQCCLALPMGPYMTDEEIDTVAKAVQEFVEE